MKVNISGASVNIIIINDYTNGVSPFLGQVVTRTNNDLLLTITLGNLSVELL